MAKKGGKGKKGKGKGGGGAAKKAPTVQDTVTPGHKVEDIVKGEGEGEATESLAPGTATNVPSAAPPEVSEPITQTAEDVTTAAETTDSGDSSTEAAETPTEPSPPSTAKTFPLTKPQPVEGESRELLMPTSLPDAKEAVEPEATKDTLQDAVDKTQASKAGLVGTLDGGDSEGQAVLPETTAKESKLTTPTTAPEPVVITDANAPVSEPVGAEEALEAPGTTGLAEKAAAAERAETGAVAGEPATTSTAGVEAVTLPERPKEKGIVEAEPTVISPAESVDSAAHAKRPYESSLFHRDEDHKPPKIPKVEEDIASAAQMSKAVPAVVAPVSTETKAEDEAAQTSKAVPAVVAPVSTETKAEDLQAEVPSEQTAQPPIVPGLGAKPTDKPLSDVEVSGPQAPEPVIAAPTVAEAVTELTPVVPSVPVELQTTKALAAPETPRKTQPSVAAAAAAAAMKGKSASTPEKVTLPAVPSAEAAGEAEDLTQPEPKPVAAETQPEEEAVAKDTAVDQAQEAEKRKSGFWAWIKRKVKGA